MSFLGFIATLDYVVAFFFLLVKICKQYLGSTFALRYFLLLLLLLLPEAPAGKLKLAGCPSREWNVSLFEVPWLMGVNSVAFGVCLRQGLPLLFVRGNRERCSCAPISLTVLAWHTCKKPSFFVGCLVAYLLLNCLNTCELCLCPSLCNLLKLRQALYDFTEHYSLPQERDRIRKHRKCFPAMFFQVT